MTKRRRIASDQRKLVIRSNQERILVPVKVAEEYKKRPGARWYEEFVHCAVDSDKVFPVYDGQCENCRAGKQCRPSKIRGVDISATSDGRFEATEEWLEIPEVRYTERNIIWYPRNFEGSREGQPLRVLLGNVSPRERRLFRDRALRFFQTYGVQVTLDSLGEYVDRRINSLSALARVWHRMFVRWSAGPIFSQPLAFTPISGPRAKIRNKNSRVSVESEGVLPFELIGKILQAYLSAYYTDYAPPVVDMSTIKLPLGDPMLPAWTPKDDLTLSPVLPSPSLNESGGEWTPSKTTRATSPRKRSIRKLRDRNMVLKT